MKATSFESFPWWMVLVCNGVGLAIYAIGLYLEPVPKAPILANALYMLMHSIRISKQYGFLTRRASILPQNLPRRETLPPSGIVWE